MASANLIILVTSKISCHAGYLKKVAYQTRDLQVRYPVAEGFLFHDFSLLTSDACEKKYQWLWKENCVSIGVRKP